MKNNLISVFLCLAAAVPTVAQKADKRLAESTTILKTLLAKNEIPKALLAKAECAWFIQREEGRPWQSVVGAMVGE